MAPLFQTVVYIQVRRRWVSIRVLSWAGGDSGWEGEPRIRVTSKMSKRGEREVFELDQGVSEGILSERTFCLFSHCRVAIDQFDDTCTGMKMLLRQAKLKRAPTKPAYVFHLREDWPGGLADIERRAFYELGKQCGAGRVLICEQSAELSPPEILALAKAKSAP